MPVLHNTRHEAFAQARAAGHTIDAAYVAAGYKRHSGNAARLSANESIQQRISQLQETAAEKVGIEAAHALEEIALVAFSDIRDLFDRHGRLLPVDALPDRVAKAIQSIKVKSQPPTDSKSDDPVVTVEIKLWDKNAALEKLAKHFRLYDGKDERKEDPAAALLAAIMGAAKPLPVATDPEGSKKNLTGRPLRDDRKELGPPDFRRQPANTASPCGQLKPRSR